MTANVWINEVDCEQPGDDTAEFVEVAGAAGTSLDGWNLNLYGSDGHLYKQVGLSGTLANTVNGFGFASTDFAPDSLEDSPDGFAAAPSIALTDDEGNVVQFISMGASGWALDGLAAGHYCQNVGSDHSSTSGSIQLSGDGSKYSDFVWVFGDTSDGTIDIGQSFGGVSSSVTFSGDTSQRIFESRAPDAEGKIVARDGDAGGKITFVAEKNVTSEQGLGVFNIDKSGHWTYHLEGDPAHGIPDLPAGLQRDDTITVKTVGGVEAHITVTIVGVNNNVGSDDFNDRRMNGTPAMDYISGLGGNDKIDGKYGDDVIVGGSGHDKMTGGQGADIFVFNKGDSPAGSKDIDIVTDFTHAEHDLIDLSSFNGNLHVTTTQNAALVQHNGVWIEHDKGHDIVHINDDKKEGFDEAIHVDTKTHLNLTDFIL